MEVTVLQQEQMVATVATRVVKMADPLRHQVAKGPLQTETALGMRMDSPRLRMLTVALRIAAPESQANREPLPMAIAQAETVQRTRPLAMTRPQLGHREALGEAPTALLAQIVHLLALTLVVMVRMRTLLQARAARKDRMAQTTA
jgi:hypothetical protein